MYKKGVTIPQHSTSTILAKQKLCEDRCGGIALNDIMQKMQKRILFGLIAVLSALAAQDQLFSGVGNSVIPPKISTLEHTPTPSNQLPTSQPATTVTRVVDGDTIIVSINGTTEKVRLIGVDTPETVDPRKPVQCFGNEASAFTKSLLTDESVHFESDPTQGDRDKYGRLLRYVFLSDGTLVNQQIIALGYGHEYTYRIPYKYQAKFKAAERIAREGKKGLWGPSACSKN